MQIDLNKKYKTRDGNAVKILQIDRDYSTYPVIALVTIGGNDVNISYTLEGKYLTDGKDSPADLVEIIDTERKVTMLQISIHSCPDTPLRPALNSAHATAISISNATGKDVEVTVYDGLDTFTFSACFKTGIVTETRNFKED